MVAIKAAPSAITYVSEFPKRPQKSLWVGGSGGNGLRGVLWLLGDLLLLAISVLSGDGQISD